MSCRETSGNSAVTSLAKFVTGAGEQTVSRVFHRVRRDAYSTLGADGLTPADAAEVSAFLNDAAVVARTHPTIRDSRRASLLSRFSSALDDVRAGRGPNRATFLAWTELHAAVTAEPDSAPIVDADPTIGTTADGLTISLGDVQAAWRAAETASLGLQGRSRYQDLTFTQREIAQAVAASVTSEVDRARRLQAAYDATDAGFDVLQSAPEANPAHAGHGPWAERVRAAREARGASNPIQMTRDRARELGIDGARRERDAALVEARAAQGTTDAQPATSRFQRAQRVWLYAVAELPDISPVTGQDLQSSGPWASVSSTARVPREDIWRAIELVAMDLDRARVRIGRLGETDVARRAVSRAEARQAVLDAEGHGLIDPVNRRYAEAIRLRRSMPSRAGLR